MTNIKATEQQNKDILDIHARVMKLMDFTEQKAWLWIGAANPMFGGISPAEVIINGKVDRLNAFIKGAEEEMAELRELLKE